MNNNPDWQSRLGSLLEQMGGPVQDETPEETPERKPAQTERLTISYERKGRGGKSATIISGFTISDEELSSLASDMKKTLGTGGSARGGEILIQGDRREDVRAYLKRHGYKL